MSDREITEIASLTDWESLRPYLELTRQQKVDIRKSYPGDYLLQKCDCLRQWKYENESKATYGALITAAKRSQYWQLADGVRACW